MARTIHRPNPGAVGPTQSKPEILDPPSRCEYWGTVPGTPVQLCVHLSAKYNWHRIFLVTTCATGIFTQLRPIPKTWCRQVGYVLDLIHSCTPTRIESRYNVQYNCSRTFTMNNCGICTIVRLSYKCLVQTTSFIGMSSV